MAEIKLEFSDEEAPGVAGSSPPLEEEIAVADGDPLSPLTHGLAEDEGSLSNGPGSWQDSANIDEERTPQVGRSLATPAPDDITDSSLSTADAMRRVLKPFGVMLQQDTKPSSAEKKKKKKPSALPLVQQSKVGIDSSLPSLMTPSSSVHPAKKTSIIKGMSIQLERCDAREKSKQLLPLPESTAEEQKKETHLLAAKPKASGAETPPASMPAPSDGSGGEKRKCEASIKKSECAKFKMFLKKAALFWPIKVAQLLCVVYILVLTFSEAPVGIVDPISSNIIDPASPENTANGVILVNGAYRPVVAEGTWQKFCLAVSRMSAFSLYPVLIFVFITKCKALYCYLSKTPLSVYLNLNDPHELHTYAGNYIAVDVWFHTVFHILRWANQGNMYLLFHSRSGITGLIVVLATPLIVLPMMFWKRKIPYEIRKGLHYLFVLFAVGMCYHVPMSAIPNGGFIAPVMGASIILYALDATFVFLFMTEKIETTTFHVLSSGVQITLDVSESFQNRSKKGGFAYVCFPWVNRYQWHAFSLFEDPSNPSSRQMFILKAGDWTEAVHQHLQRSTVRPVWIQGPFPSPYGHAVAYDNQILVASGIGITPALSVIRAHRESRRINLVWAVRDPAMLEFFLEHLHLNQEGWSLIFYTGKKPLVPAIEELADTNVRIIKGRPDLKAAIPNIIYGIESENWLPETYTATEMERIKCLLIERTQELEEAGNLSSQEKIAELTAFVNDHGFSFTELIGDIQESNKQRRGSEKAPEVEPLLGFFNSRLQQEQDRSTVANANAQSDALLRANEILQEMQAFGILQDIESFGNHEYSPKHSFGEDAQNHSDALPSTNFRRSVMLKRGKGSRDSFRAVSRRLARKRDSRQSAWMALQSNLDAPDGVVASSLITSAFKPWEKNAEAEAYVSGLDPKRVLSTWGIMYCGGSQPVMNILEEVSEEYRVALHIDSFAW